MLVLSCLCGINSKHRSPAAMLRHVLISDPKRRAVLGPHLAPVVEPRRRDVGVAEPFLDLGDVGFMRERVGGGRGAQRMHT